MSFGYASICLFHLDKAHNLDINSEDIKAALEVGTLARVGAAAQMDTPLYKMRKKYELNYQPG